MALMLGGEPPELCQRGPAASRQVQGVGAPVGGRSDAADEIAVFEAVQQMNQPGALDPEPLGDRHLAQAGIGANHRHHRILRRADIDGGERADKILKNPDLKAPHRITGVAGQRVEGDLVSHDVAIRAAVSGLLAVGSRSRARARFGRSRHVTVSRHRLSFYRFMDLRGRLLLTTTIVVLTIGGKRPFRAASRHDAGQSRTSRGQEETMTIAAASGDNSRSLFATPAIVADRRADGSMVVRSTVPLQPGARCIGDWLEHWARQAPERIFLADRAGADAPWTTVTYRDALQQVRASAAWILAQGLSAERPLVILSDNSVEHALFALAAQHVGVPSAAISPAYSLMSKDFDKLRSMVTLLGPGAIYVSGTKPFAAALAAIQPLHSAAIISGSAGDTDAISFRSVAATPETADVGKAFAAITPDTIAKFLFTSGSTGTPKAVINTQRMLTSSQQAKAQTWTFLEDIGEKLVILDWLPWSHTFGANHNFNLVLRNGGTLYVDGGKPAPGLFATSLANLRSVMPTVYFNVPRGFDMLIAALRSDEALCKKFFNGVKFAFYAGCVAAESLG